MSDLQCARLTWRELSSRDTGQELLETLIEAYTRRASRETEVPQLHTELRRDDIACFKSLRMMPSS